MAKKLEIYLKKHSIFDVTKSLKKFHDEKKKRIKCLAKKDGDTIAQFEEIYNILTTVTTFIWLAHGLEEVYQKRLSKEVPKYVKENVDGFIGDASFPSKKNSHALMEAALRKGISPKRVSEEFGWLKMRDFDDEPFSEEDMKKLKKEIKSDELHKKVKIPKELKKLFKEVEELVFFRTARTDVFYELMCLSRPVFKKVADYYEIPYSDMKHYTVQSLIRKKPKRYGKSYTLACYGNDSSFSEEPILKERKNQKADYVEGIVACKGNVKGAVKIVLKVSEIDKVKQGDILVTQMTFPAFAPAMAKASAFVTDEGGLTCHAAIVAREMNKPCIIGTKIATKTFKDGDLVEVDANRGVVKIIKRNAS
ncbi:hypothetical protein HYU07_02590 [Candidatus Woesearchaeota archaeon]|nr:hypothetical protein [Candidatus Woesearchaeota archaeon]